MTWKEAGEAWGDRATDWAYLFEPYARQANDGLLDRLGVGRGTRLFDVACGSGFAARRAADRGAIVTGLDASAALLAIARSRTPEGDFHLGDMFALPFADRSFDVVTSFNGIWKGCEDAMKEAQRVVRPGGVVGVTFWGAPKRMGLLPFFAKLVAMSPPDHGESTLNMGDTGRVGVVEAMFSEAGLEFLERGTFTVVNEFPDLGLAVRALASSGPSWPALQAMGWTRFASEMEDVLRPFAVDGLGVRITSEFGWAIARRSVD
ncbi:MAG: hypothetical protein NVSMB4_02510 [Acidimicrobiales bacterium]